MEQRIDDAHIAYPGIIQFPSLEGNVEVQIE